MVRGLLVAIAVIAGCSKPPRVLGPPPHRAFYYWRTTFRLSPQEQLALAELHVTRLYTRMFDVDWIDADKTTTQLGKITPADGTRIPDGVEMVPVVYLRNAVFTQLPAAKLPELARTTWVAVQERAKLLGFVPHELQLDCDWTDSTRDAFFAFLTALRATTRADAIALSATIRLHQVKYREQTGVPPVDRGMLMFYNMGQFSADPEARAIFDAAAAERYVARIADYPLVLDAALPIWSWTVHLRDDRVQGLLQSTDPDELPRLDFLQKSGSDRYVTLRSSFLHGTLLREGDVLKIEVTGPAETQAAATMIAAHLAAVPEPRTISLFDLSERNLNHHGIENLDHVFGTTR